jgi:hypothetical protein
VQVAAAVKAAKQKAAVKAAKAEAAAKAYLSALKILWLAEQAQCICHAVFE